MAWGRWRQVITSRPPRPSGPLISARARPAVITIIALCVAVVTALGIRSAGHTHAGPFDRSVDHWIQAQLGLSSPGLTALTWLGDPPRVVVITAVMALLCLRARWWRGVALTVLTVPAASGLTEGILKPAVGRTILGLLSLPSGHTTAVFSMATVAAVLLSHTRLRLRRPLTVAAYLLAAAVGVAMVAQGFHYFTDTIAGAGVGTGTVLLGALLIDAVAARLRARASRPQALPSGDLASR
jgi:membrane-associated phospholipid phosphatase